MLIYYLLAVLFDVTLLAVSACALIGGERDERIGALIAITASLLTLALQNIPGWQWTDPIRPMIADAMALAAFLALALRSRRWWPLWAAAFQLDAVATEVVALVLPPKLVEGYVNAEALWAYPVLAAIAIGTWRRRRERRTRPRA